MKGISSRLRAAWSALWGQVDFTQLIDRRHRVVTIHGTEYVFTDYSLDATRAGRRLYLRLEERVHYLERNRR